MSKRGTPTDTGISKHNVQIAKGLNRPGDSHFHPIALMVGEAGIGKTRLANELVAWARAQEAEVLSGQAFELGGQLSSQPLVEALRPRLEEENVPEDLLDDLWLAELSLLLPELRVRNPDLPAPAQDELMTRLRLCEAVARLLDVLIRRVPLVLLLDDLHWVDGASLGIDLPVEAEKRGVFQVKPVRALPHTVPFTIGVDAGWSLRERDGRLLVKFPDHPHDWEPIRTWLAQRIPAAAVGQPEAHWTGFYEMTPDQHPLVGETARPGVWASCGFSGHGVMHAPAVAESLAAMILGQSLPVDISALSPLRMEPLVDIPQV